MAKNDLVKQKEEIALVEQEYEKRSKIRESRYNRELDKIQESIDMRENERQEALKKTKLFGEFSSNVKKSLLVETLVNLFEASLPMNLKRSVYAKNIGFNMINTYVDEHGVDNILTKSKYNSLFLSELSKNIYGFHKAIIETAQKKDNEYQIETIFKDKFFDNIKGEDFDEVTDTIRMRVSDALEDFIQSNKNNKLDIEEVLATTKDKIDNAKFGTPEDVKQEFANIGKRKISSIKNRKYGILEAIVQNISRSALINESLGESLSDENGISMEKIVESATAMYTFLEMLNTAKIDTIDEGYVKDFLSNLSKKDKEKIQDKKKKEAKEKELKFWGDKKKK